MKRIASTCCLILSALLLSVGCNDSEPLSASPAIVGGTPATSGMYPAQVAVLDKRIESVYWSLRCGGTLISDRWVITAAHCFDRYGADPSKYDVGVGMSNLPNGAVPEGRVAISEIKIHPYYRRGNGTTIVPHDIALIKLASPVAQRPLPYAGWRQNWTSGTVVGWGSLDASGTRPSQLYKAELPIIIDYACSYSSIGFNPANIICAGDINETLGTCHGDSGGPLIVDGILVGVLSGGGCGRPGYVSVFTELAGYLDFIQGASGVRPIANNFGPRIFQ